MKNIYFPDEEILENDLYFICAMIERVARKIHRGRRAGSSDFYKSERNVRYNDRLYLRIFAKIYVIIILVKGCVLYATNNYSKTTNFSKSF